jgi:hypothetical protein
MLRVAQNDTARLRNLNEASCLTTLGTIVAMLLVGATTNAQQLVRVGYSGTGVAKNLHKTIERTGLWKKRGLDIRLKAIFHAIFSRG